MLRGTCTAYSTVFLVVLCYLTTWVTSETFDRLTYHSHLSKHPKFSLDAYAKLLVKGHSFNPSPVKRLYPGPKRIRVGIIGAGLSGLYCALILQDLGIDYEVLEANYRIGGRMFTYHFPGHSSETDNYNYYDVGAVRFPVIKEMDRLVGNHTWSLIKYLNAHVHPKHKVRPIPSIDDHDNNVFYFNGVKAAAKQVWNVEGVDWLNFGKSNGGHVPDHFVKRPWPNWISDALKPLLSRLEKDFDSGFKTISRLDKYTVRGYLLDTENGNVSYPTEVVDWLETMNIANGRYLAALIDFIYMFKVRSSKEWLIIDHGSSRLTDAMASLLHRKPIIGQRVTTIKKQSKYGGGLDVYTTHLKRSYDFVISTPLFSALKDVRFIPPLHYQKRMAIRVLRHPPAVKVALQFRTRWWEDFHKMHGKPMWGGDSFTDLPVRLVVYPAYGVNCTNCPGILVATYAWERDADYMSGLSDHSIEALCLNNLIQLHGEIVHREYTGRYKVHRWDKDPHTQGAYLLYDAGHLPNYYPYLIAPELDGRLHFSGDSCSVHHLYAMGALISGYRAVNDVLQVANMKQKVRELRHRWGTIEEPMLNDQCTYT